MDETAGFVGLISDTHGLLRPEAVAALAGARLILHAGDVGSPDVLESLGRIAPVTAVRGNTDRGATGALPPTELVTVAPGVDVYLIHILDDLDLDPKAAGVAAVVYGHSHAPRAERRDGVWYLNPGSAGPRRFSLPITVARLWFETAGLRMELVTIEPAR